MSLMQNFFEQFAWAAERHAGRTAIDVQHKDRLDSFTYARLREMAEIGRASCRERVYLCV